MTRAHLEFEELPPDEALRQIEDTLLPKSYFEDMHALHEAAKKWIAARPGVTFAFALPRSFFNKDVMVIGPLDALEQFALDDVTKDFVRTIDSDTGKRCTLMQFRTGVLDLLTRQYEIKHGGPAS